MKKIAQLKINPKMLAILATAALLVAVGFFSTQKGESEDPLREATEGARLTLTSVSENYESLTQFMQEDETESRQLLEAARLTLENAKARLNSAGSTRDEYVQGMVDNYQDLAQASGVMAQGVENLLTISKNLTNALNYYWQKNYEKASEQALYCLKILTPLLSDFAKSNDTLNAMNVFYIPSGQRDELTLRVSQYRNETRIYNQYVFLLRSILKGKAYLEQNAFLEERLRQLQNAVANGDYEAAEAYLQEISDILQSLEDPEYQDAVDIAAQLNPDLLSGKASDLAEELENRLRDLEEIGAFENYLQSLRQYLKALTHYERGEFEEAQEAINEGAGRLGQGHGGDSELQGLYEGLEGAFSALEMRIRGHSDPG